MSNSHLNLDHFLTTKEVANYLRLQKNTLEIWRLQGRGPAFVRLGRAIRYRLGDIEKFVERQTANSTSERR